MRPSVQAAIGEAEQRRLSGVEVFPGSELPTVRDILRAIPPDAGGRYLLAERLRLGRVSERDLLRCVAVVPDTDGYDRTILRQAIAHAVLGLARPARILATLGGDRVRVLDVRLAPVERSVVFEAYPLDVPEIDVLHADRPTTKGGVVYPVANGEVLHLEDATLTIGTDVIEMDGQYYVDNVAWTGARSQNPINDARLLAERDGQAVVASRIGVAKRVGRAVWLGTPMLENWGHWVYEGLLRLELLAREPGFEELEVLVPESVPAEFLDFASLIFPAARFRSVPVGTSVEIGECLYAPLRTFHAHNVFWSEGDEALRLNGDPQLFGALRARVLAAVKGDSSPESGGLVFLDRAATARYRVSRNTDRLREIAESAGFRAVDPGVLSPLDQLELFLTARAICGQTGSGLFLTPLAPPGCSMLMIGSDFSHDWAGLALAAFASTGIPPQFVLGERDFVAPGFSERLYHQDFTLSEDAWSRIEEWCRLQADRLRG